MFVHLSFENCFVFVHHFLHLKPFGHLGYDAVDHLFKRDRRVVHTKRYDMQAEYLATACHICKQLRCAIYDLNFELSEKGVHVELQAGLGCIFASSDHV